MKKVDVLFLYETRVRELENICLLKYELERRGYTVAVQNTWNELAQKKLRPKYDAKVVVTHAMYHDGIYQFVKSIVGKAPKIVNMQCEQIGTIGDRDSKKSRYVLTGVAKQSMNICWGDVTVKRLTEDSKIDDRHIRKTGNVSLDFCREELRGYYKDRNTLLETYNIPADKSVNLFISSFSYVNLPEEMVKQSDVAGRDEFIYLSNESFHKVLGWFDRLLTEMDDQVIVYRPHPAEAENKDLLKMCEKFPGRFYVVREESVKQWIYACDKVYSWFSTSAVEAYAFHVPCAILRPHELPRHRELEVYEGSSFITEYDVFRTSILEGVTNSLKKEVFEQYYSMEDRLSYQRVADAIEDVYQDDAYLIDFDDPNDKKDPFCLKVKKMIRGAVSLVADCLPEKSKLLAKYKTKKTSSKYAQQLQKSNYASPEEILEIQKKLAKLLDGADRQN